MVRMFVNGEIQRPSFWYDAKCLGVGPEIFFPERGVQTNAKSYCGRCPVRAECLEFGLNERFGIWGGAHTKERREIRSERDNMDDEMVE